jgi:membrane protein YdbS with pleckstrin-like domain
MTELSWVSLEIVSHTSVIGAVLGFQNKLWNMFEIVFVVVIIDVVVVIVVVFIVAETVRRRRKKGMVKLLFFCEIVV